MRLPVVLITTMGDGPGPGRSSPEKGEEDKREQREWKAGDHEQETNGDLEKFTSPVEHLRRLETPATTFPSSLWNSDRRDKESDSPFTSRLRAVLENAMGVVASTSMSEGGGAADTVTDECSTSVAMSPLGLLSPPHHPAESLRFQRERHFSGFGSDVIEPFFHEGTIAQRLAALADAFDEEFCEPCRAHEEHRVMGQQRRFGFGGGSPWWLLVRIMVEVIWKTWFVKPS